MEPIQHSEEIVDIAEWRIDEDYRRYPEGTRTKALFYSPMESLYPFLKPNYPYLFKLSSHRYPEQFWMEIFAYQLASKMGLCVARYFVGISSNEQLTGALSEWYFTVGQEIEKPGGDFFSTYIRDFDRKKGRQHNFSTIVEIFLDLEKNYADIGKVWLKYWAQLFLFDALIGNTDRHQDNWSVIMDKKANTIRLAPAFDNGTSLGHEIRQEKFSLAHEKNWLNNYIAKGYHHIRWDKSDSVSVGHFQLLEKLRIQYPESNRIMIACINRVNFKDITDILAKLCSFNVPVRLTKERAAFMVKLLEARYKRIKLLLES